MGIIPPRLARQAGRQAGRQAVRQAGRQAVRQAVKQAGRQAGGKKDKTEKKRRALCVVSIDCRYIQQ